MTADPSLSPLVTVSSTRTLRTLHIVALALAWLALVVTVLLADSPIEELWDRYAEGVPLMDASAVFLTLIVSIPVIALALVLLTMLDRRLNWSFFYHGTTVMLAQMVTCGGLKQLFGRLRPDVANEATIFYGPTLDHLSFAFPSGHATASFALAGFLSMHYPRWRWLFVIVAAAICLARVQLDRHFPSDVVAGSLLGWYLAVGIVRGLRRRQEAALARQHEQETPLAA